MLLNDIYESLHEREEVNFESEANMLYYVVTYNENRVEIYEIEEYHYDGDNWGEIETKQNKYLYHTIEASIEEYLDAVIHFANIMSQDCGNEIMRYEYPYVLHGLQFHRGKI